MNAVNSALNILFDSLGFLPGNFACQRQTLLVMPCRQRLGFIFVSTTQYNTFFLPILKILLQRNSSVVYSLQPTV